MIIFATASPGGETGIHVLTTPLACQDADRSVSIRLRAQFVKIPKKYSLNVEINPLHYFVFIMIHYTYILHSHKFDKYYIGLTNEIDGRLKRHNSGSEKATQPYIPWTLLWYTQKSSRSEAMLLEKKLKNLSKLRIKSFILKYSDENLLGKI